MAGSVMRVPTLVLNRGEDLLMLVAWEYGEYFFDAILDAGETVGIARAGAAAVPAAVADAAGGDRMIGLLRKHRFFRSHPLRASYDASSSAAAPTAWPRPTTWPRITA